MQGPESIIRKRHRPPLQRATTSTNLNSIQPPLKKFKTTASKQLYADLRKECLKKLQNFRSEHKAVFIKSISWTIFFHPMISVQQNPAANLHNSLELQYQRVWAQCLAQLESSAQWVEAIKTLTSVRHMTVYSAFAAFLKQLCVDIRDQIALTDAERGTVDVIIGAMPTVRGDTDSCSDSESEDAELHCDEHVVDEKLEAKLDGLVEQMFAENRANTAMGN